MFFRYRSVWTFLLPGNLLSVTMRLPLPLLTGYIIDNVITHRSTVSLNTIGIGLILFTALYQSLNYASDYLAFRIFRSITIRLRLRLLRHIHSLPLSSLAGRETGYLMARVIEDPQYVNSLGSLVLNLTGSVLTFLVGAAAMWMINPRLALVSMSVVPFFAASFLLCRDRIKTLDEQQKEQSAVISRGLKEALSHIASIKMFLLDVRESSRYLQAMRTELALSVRAFNYSYLISAVSGFLGAMGPLLVVWYGGHEVMRQRLTVGELVACSALLSFLYGPTKAVVTSNVSFLRALVSLNRVFQILDEPSEASDAPRRGAPLEPRNFGIEFRSVYFGYGSSTAVLRNVSLDIAAGETIGIVGPVGAGKSTLISLLPRFYEPDAGTILIGGEDIHRIPLRRLRQYVSIMTQVPFLVSGSIYENIRIGNLRASRAEVMRAADLANATSFIETLEKGFSTEAGENGQRLSGGQKQLICLARVILRDAPILILDEPTSAVDAPTERLIQASLASFMAGRTTMVVSHRLSMLLNVSRIAVMEEGQVSDVAPHSELIRRNGYYGAMSHVESGIM